MDIAANRGLSLPPRVPQPNGWARQVNEWANITQDTSGTYEDTGNPKGLGDQEKILSGKKHSTRDLQNDQSGVTHVKLPVAAGAREQWAAELWRCVRSKWKTAGQGPKGVRRGRKCHRIICASWGSGGELLLNMWNYFLKWLVYKHMKYQLTRSEWLLSDETH